MYFYNHKYSYRTKLIYLSLFFHKKGYGSPRYKLFSLEGESAVYVLFMLALDFARQNDRRQLLTDLCVIQVLQTGPRFLGIAPSVTRQGTEN